MVTRFDSTVYHVFSKQIQEVVWEATLSPIPTQQKAADYLLNISEEIVE